MIGDGGGNKAVAIEDSVLNNTVNDVIGNKNDTTLSAPGMDSLYGIAAFMAYYHVHSPSVVYPRDADPIVLTAGVEVLWGEAAFNRDTNQVRGSQIPIQGAPVPSGTRISAALLSGTGSDTAAIKIYTHEYPIS